MRSAARAAALSLLPALLLAGCSQRPVETHDQRLQQQAAQGADQVRHDLRDAGVEARKALKNARRDTRDVVTGARQGWKEGSPRGSADRVDLNHASVADLETLPGMTHATARRIVDHRPYRRANALLEQGIVSRGEWDRLEGHVTAE